MKEEGTNRFCLIVLSDWGILEEQTCEHGSGNRFCADALAVLCDQLCSVDSEVPVDAARTVRDPSCAVFEGQPSVGFSVAIQKSCHQQIQTYSEEVLELFGDMKWFSLTNDKHLLSQVCDAIKTSKPSQSQSCQTRDDKSEVEHLAEDIHKLTDLLPVPDGIPLNVYWIIGGWTPDVSVCLPLLGALKRLKEWHCAHITLVSNPNLDRSLLGEQWGQFLNLSVTDLTSLNLNAQLDAVWHGSFIFEKKNCRLVLPGFKLRPDRKDRRTAFLESDAFLQDCYDPSRLGNDAVLPGNEIRVLDIASKSSVPLHMFLPLKLKLDLHPSPQRASSKLIDWFCQECNTELAVIGRLSFEAAPSKKRGHKNTEAWMRHVKLNGSAKVSGSSTAGKNASSMSRLCMLCADGRGGVDAFVLRPPEQLSGRITNVLAVIASSGTIAAESKEGPFYFRDLTDGFSARESTLEQSQVQLIQDELARRNEEGREFGFRCSELTDLITTARVQTIREMREKAVSAPHRRLDAPSAVVTQPKSEFAPSPSSWPERHWLHLHEPPTNADLTTDSSKSVWGFDIREILKKFKPDGRAVREDLSPIMATGGGNPDGCVGINTSFDVIRRTKYPEALGRRFHGVEYCLDACDALQKDSLLANLRNSVIELETMSSCVEVDKSSTQPRPRSGAMGTRQKVRQTRVTRKRTLAATSAGSQRVKPDPRTSKSVKRKRQNTEDDGKEGKNEDGAKKKSHETRSQRHQRRLKRVVDIALKDNGVDSAHSLYKFCSERLYRVCKSFLKDLNSSHGLNEEMKRLAKSNVEQVITFESKRLEKKQNKK